MAINASNFNLKKRFGSCGVTWSPHGAIDVILLQGSVLSCVAVRFQNRSHTSHWFMHSVNFVSLEWEIYTLLIISSVPKMWSYERDSLISLVPASSPARRAVRWKAGSVLATSSRSRPDRARSKNLPAINKIMTSVTCIRECNKRRQCVITRM